MTGFAEGEKQTGDINISIWVQILKYSFLPEQLCP